MSYFSRDVASLAVLTCQTPLQYLRSHQHLLLEMPLGTHTAEPNDIFHSEASASSASSSSSSSRGGVPVPGSAQKRRASGGDVGGGGHHDESLQETFLSKRARQEEAVGRGHRQQQRVYPQPWSRGEPGHGHGHGHGGHGHAPHLDRPPPPLEVSVNGLNGAGSSASGGGGGGGGQHEDEWRNIHVVSDYHKIYQWGR